MAEEKHALLIRTDESDEGTFGPFSVEDLHLVAGELPWRNNEIGLSRIPAGTHTAHYREDGKHGPCYQLDDVPGRTAIQIHVGNWCGDKSKRLLTDVDGCIVLGMRKGVLNNQKAVVRSGDAMKAFLAKMDKAPLVLEIVDQFAEPSASAEAVV